MKKQLLLIIGFVMVTGLLVSTSVQAQYWNLNGTHIYNNNSGNVGIGISTPTTTLDVYSASYTTLKIESPYAGTGSPVQNIATMQLVNSATGDLVYMGLRKNPTGSHDMIQSVYDASTSTWREFIRFTFATRKYQMSSGVNDAEWNNAGKILFNNAGGVGINMGAVAIPSGVSLAVNGKVNCKEVEVTLSGWSDHVFKSGYQLKSLGEVENYITTNKHLPDVPSEAEVLHKGTNLGQMDALLLQKIEELTLYVIQLKKENDQLKNKVDGMMR
jgi:hypothetical protein